MISIIHPTRSRPEQSEKTILKWLDVSSGYIDLIVSVDSDDPKLNNYKEIWTDDCLIVNNNRSSVEAINRAAVKSTQDILMVVSDDTDCFPGWSEAILKECEGKHDFILKTQDGIQNYIITNPIMDRAYYNRFGYIYHPDFSHLFCDTWLTVMADVTGRKITSNLMFKHNHYSVNGDPPDELHKRNDATWKQGQDTFIRLAKQLTPQERARITDQGMKNWLRNHGV